MELINKDIPEALINSVPKPGTDVAFDGVGKQNEVFFYPSHIVLWVDDSSCTPWGRDLAQSSRVYDWTWEKYRILIEWLGMEGTSGIVMLQPSCLRMVSQPPHLMSD